MEADEQWKGGGKGEVGWVLSCLQPDLRSLRGLRKMKIEANTCSLKWPTMATTTTPASNLQEHTHRHTHSCNNPFNVYCITKLLCTMPPNSATHLYKKVQYQHTYIRIHNFQQKAVMLPSIPHTHLRLRIGHVITGIHLNPVHMRQVVPVGGEFPYLDALDGQGPGLSK